MLAWCTHVWPLKYNPARALRHSLSLNPNKPSIADSTSKSELAYPLGFKEIHPRDVTALEECLTHDVEILKDRKTLEEMMERRESASEWQKLRVYFNEFNDDDGPVLLPREAAKPEKPTSSKLPPPTVSIPTPKPAIPGTATEKEEIPAKTVTIADPSPKVKHKKTVLLKSDPPMSIGNPDNPEKRGVGKRGQDKIPGNKTRKTREKLEAGKFSVEMYNAWFAESSTPSASSSAAAQTQEDEEDELVAIEYGIVDAEARFKSNEFTEKDRDWLFSPDNSESGKWLEAHDLEKLRVKAHDTYELLKPDEKLPPGAKPLPAILLYCKKGGGTTFKCRSFRQSSERLRRRNFLSSYFFARKRAFSSRYSIRRGRNRSFRSIECVFESGTFF